MPFKKGGRNERYNWEWEEEEIEKVKKWKYFSMSLCSSYSKANHRDRKKERKLWKDFRMKMMCFDGVIRGMLLYR